MKVYTGEKKLHSSSTWLRECPFKNIILKINSVYVYKEVYKVFFFFLNFQSIVDSFHQKRSHQNSCWIELMTGYFCLYIFCFFSFLSSPNTERHTTYLQRIWCLGHWLLLLDSNCVRKKAQKLFFSGNYFVSKCCQSSVNHRCHNFCSGCNSESFGLCGWVGGRGGGEREERLKFPFVLVNSTINFCSQHFLSRKRMTREKKQATFSDENIFLLLSLLSQQKIIF